MDSENIKKPSLIWSLTEIGRAVFEWSTLVPYKLLFNRYEDTGDGHPVLILPGFMATDMSTVPLRSFIYELGYAVYGWGMGRNYASIEYLELIQEKLDHIYQKHNQPVSLIGWSLGGIFARQIAKANPDKIRQVITLGSPFRGVDKPNNAKWLFKLIQKTEVEEHVDPELLADIPNPAPVPTTAIYSKQDGVVPWQTCLEQVENDIHQNIEVRGSHIGLGVNPTVLDIIADRLQYDDHNWQKFESTNQLKNKMFYPSLRRA